MDEFNLDEALNRVLSDPAELEKLSRVAAQLFGGTAGEASAGDGATDPGIVDRLRGLAGGVMGQGNDKTALLNALSPYLREDRRQKLQKALRLSQAARVAGIAMREFGGEGGGL